MNRTFHPVWFRQTPFDHQKTTWIRHDTGNLVVSDHAATFTSKPGRVEIRGIKRITQGRARPDWTPFRLLQFLDEWIRFDYDDGDVAILHDGGYRGWRGIFGGNRNIVDALGRLQADA